MNSYVPGHRGSFLKRIFPDGVPRLWCPPLTHYDRDGAIDGARIAAHLHHLSPYVGGFLIPGSTGDGWELSSDERRSLLGLNLEQARKLQRQALIGALHPDTCEAIKLIEADVNWLISRSKERNPAEVLVQARVCGFTVCPPRGKELSQAAIESALVSVLQLNLPTAIYQLPQVTQNEIGPNLAADLARRFENFIFFKDTSGSDAVMLSDQSLAGVFTARGAEGDYARWLRAAGGCYDGFLLASANCFAAELHQVIEAASTGRPEAAKAISRRVAAVVCELLREAADLPHGNPFTNANKAIDHFVAHGPKAATVAPPRLHGGNLLSSELVRRAGEMLVREELMPSRGYLE